MELKVIRMAGNLIVAVGVVSIALWLYLCVTHPSAEYGCWLLLSVAATALALFAKGGM